MKRPDRNAHDGSGTIRICDDALVQENVVGVDLGHNQGHIDLHAERAGVVDHDGSGSRDGSAELLGNGGARAEQGDVHALERIFGHLFDRDGFAVELERFADGTSGGEKFQVFDGEIALLKCKKHLDTYGTRGARDRDVN